MSTPLSSPRGSPAPASGRGFPRDGLLERVDEAGRRLEVHDSVLSRMKYSSFHSSSFFAFLPWRDHVDHLDEQA